LAQQQKLLFWRFPTVEEAGCNLGIRVLLRFSSPVIQIISRFDTLPN